MWKWIIKTVKLIWKWIKSFFNGKKDNPIVKIKVMTIFFIIFTFFINVYSQRNNLQYLIATFNQPDINNVNLWTIKWNSDSLDVFKNDTIVSIIDTSVTVKINTIFLYNTEYLFSIVAINDAGQSISTETKSYFMRSDINGDNIIDENDLILLNKKWGWTELEYRDFEDINGDGVVDGLDLIQMQIEWGRQYIP